MINQNAFTAVSVFIAGLFTIIFAASMMSHKTIETKTSIDQRHAEYNRNIIKKCHDQKLCIGGFVKWRPNTKHNPSIQMIVLGGIAVGRVPLSALIEIEADDKRLNEIEDIILPHDEPTIWSHRWTETGTAYLQQFVLSR